MRALVFAVVLSGCEEHGQLVCPRTGLDDIPDSCFAALVYVNRDTSELVARQEEVDRYFDRWRRLVEAEPVLFRRVPLVYRSGGTQIENAFELFTSNRQLLDALEPAVRSAVPITGVPVFDSLMSELTTPTVLGHDDPGDGIGRVGFMTDTQFNEEVMHARLLQIDASLPDPVVRPQDDGVWRWRESGPGVGTDEDTAEIEFTFGWGDCQGGCAFFHSVRAIVPPTGRPEVFDLGGDPLPTGLALSPNTKPPPE